METSAPSAFFSYSRNDSEFVLRLAEDLKAAGANVWLDQLDIEPGQRWARAVQEALVSSPRVLVVLSPSSVESSNVQDEVTFALEERKIVIPILYQDCKIPLQIRGLHYADFRTDYARGLNALLRTLRVQQQAAIPSIPVKQEQLEPEPERKPQTQRLLVVARAWFRRHWNWAVPLAFTAILLAFPAIMPFIARHAPRNFDLPQSGSPANSISSPVQPARPPVVFAAGFNTILRSEDGGETWNAHNGTSETDGMCFPTPQSGWAVGYDGTILHTADGGQIWSLQTSGTKKPLNSVAFVSPQSGWAVGVDGTILRTEDGGQNWNKQASGTQESLQSVAFATPKSGWVVGDHGTALHTDDGGQIWNKQISGTQESLRSIASITPQSSWVVGYSGTILHTEDGGHTWNPQTSGTQEDLLSVAFATPKSGWAVGWKGAILHTEDGGQTWAKQTSGTKNNMFFSVVFATPKLGWAVGVAGTILHTEDGGQSWNKQISGIKETLWSVTFAPR
jgi:photosystem II stability/assembly factor-like uncharacterized protein